jgi:hypothetical protein
MSDLTRIHNIKCHRCDRPCDAFTLKSYDEIGNIISFCTFYCANFYHETTGNEIWRPKTLETVVPQSEPRYVREVRNLDLLNFHIRRVNKALRIISFEMLEKMNG